MLGQGARSLTNMLGQKVQPLPWYASNVHLRDYEIAVDCWFIKASPPCTEL